MQSRMGRRRFLQFGSALAAGAGLIGPGVARGWAEQLAQGAPHAEKLGWRLGCQAYSFNRYTLEEAVDKNRSLGLRYIEAYPNQPLSDEVPGEKINESMPAWLRMEVKQRLQDKGVKVVNYGVCGLSKNEAESRKTFDFAKEMGIETLVSEPAFDAFDTLEKLCDEYEINLALHNHPKPSPYWNPETVLQMCQGRSKRIGACADTGHWMRSDLNPLEQLKKLEGRIISFHFKDLNKFGSGAHDVPWGTGQGNVQAMLQEIHRQGIRAMFSIEYEHNWTSSLPEIAECVKAFDKMAAEIGKSA